MRAYAGAIAPYRVVAQEGQGLILMVMAMTMVSTMIGMYALQRARSTARESVQLKRSSNVINTMNGVAQYLHQIYYNEANCDPYLMNQRLNQISNRIYVSKMGRQSLAMDSGATPTFKISMGKLLPAPPAAANLPIPLGTGVGAMPAPYSQQGLGAQDVSVTYSVVPYGTLGDQGATRYEQTVTLINTCSPKDAGAYNTGNLEATRPKFGNITNAASFASAVSAEVPNTVTSKAVCGATSHARGSIDSADTTLNLRDRDIFMNYVRSGDDNGVRTTTVNDCADMNGDGIVNEVDLNVLDKTMKGYLYINAPSNQN